MSAAAGASGLRSWLQTRSFSWLTPQRLRAITILAITAALLVSTLGLGGATPPPH